MSVTRRLRLAPVASALALAALALLGTGGPSSGALVHGESAAALGAVPALAGADDLPEPEVTVRGDERVDARADRWRQGVLVALLAVGVALPLLRGWGAGPGRTAVWPAAGGRASVSVRGPPRAHPVPASGSMPAPAPVPTPI